MSLDRNPPTPGDRSGGSSCAPRGQALAVRDARPSDLAALGRLEAASFDAPWSEAALAGLLEDEHAPVLVTETRPGSGLSGFAALRHAGGEGELLRIAVDGACRRRGVGRLLLEAGISRLARCGVRTCFLEVRETNTAALALYESFGFKGVGRRRRYYPDGCDALVFRLDVPEQPISCTPPAAGANLP